MIRCVSLPRPLDSKHFLCSFESFGSGNDSFLMDAAAGDAFRDSVDTREVERRARNVAKSSEVAWSVNGETLEEFLAAGLRVHGQDSTAHAA